MQTSPRLKPTYTTITKRTPWGDLYQHSTFSVEGTGFIGVLTEQPGGEYRWHYEITGYEQLVTGATGGDRHEAERMIEFRINEPDFR